MEAIKPAQNLLKKVTGSAASLLELARALISLTSSAEPVLASGLGRDLGPLVEILALDKAKLKSLAKVLQDAEADTNAENASGISPLRMRLLQHAIGKAFFDRARAFVDENGSALRAQLQQDALGVLGRTLASASSELLCAAATDTTELETRLVKVVSGIDTLMQKVKQEPGNSMEALTYCPQFLRWRKAGVMAPAFCYRSQFHKGLVLIHSTC